MTKATTLLVMAILIVTVTMAIGLAQGSAKCTEDMACWDCKTMGNKVCGP